MNIVEGTQFYCEGGIQVLFALSVRAHKKKSHGCYAIIWFDK